MGNLLCCFRQRNLSKANICVIVGDNGGKCNYPICGNSSYCYQHTCKSAGCNSLVSSYRPYCLEHRCNVSGCRNDHWDISPYCGLHMCPILGCNEMKNKTEIRCEKHKRIRTKTEKNFTY